MMRDLTCCLNEQAVQVSCSNYTKNSCISPACIPSIKNSVTCLYKTFISTKKQMTITVTWSKTASSQNLTIIFDDDPSATFKITTTPRLFRKSKGCKSLQFRSSAIELFWDLSTARYRPGPEPVGSFSFIITVDSEIALILGDKDEKLVPKNIKADAKFALVSRREYFSGDAVYSTKAQFCDTGSVHDVLIRCGGENEGLEKNPILSVCIDKKMVIKVKKLQWNFRGNETIILDGLFVDLMWDVHDWLYNPDSGNAVFMFKTRRSGLESRLWLEDEHERFGFSFIIYACKNL